MIKTQIKKPAPLPDAQRHELDKLSVEVFRNLGYIELVIKNLDYIEPKAQNHELSFALGRMELSIALETIKQDLETLDKKRHGFI